MISRQALADYLQDFLACGEYRDYTVNGVQVEGKPEIRRMVSAVSASQAAIAYAVEMQADALLVHHGYFWKGEDAAVVGMKKRRLAALLKHDVNLFAYHLPLDQHPALGNNALFAKLLPLARVWQSKAESLLWHGELAESMRLDGVRESLSAKLDFPCCHVGDGEKTVQRIAWCTGAAQDFLQLAAQEGAQVFCSGEYAERTYHEARENGCAYMVCGHHATERAGIRALGEHLAEKFSLSVNYFDEKNPF
ncbi:MAG: Nif3-like dinuclear metal center hexameric protein [Cardiobacteriaceae bacterium]|nr:Nif3-like dinuclear metal center hexameric protein [Cardiobacteriaceae bacterium]